MIHFPNVMIRHISASLATVVVAMGLVLGGTMTEAPAAAAPTKASSFVNDTVKSTNVFRKNHSRARVKSSTCLNRYAAQWAKHIAKKQKMVHRTPDSLRRVLKKCNLRAVGENLAKGQTSGRATVDAWAKSPPHRKNLINNRYRQYGMASHWDGKRWWSVQLLAGK